MPLVVSIKWLYHASLQLSDASVSCKVGARYWTLVVLSKLFYTKLLYYHSKLLIIAFTVIPLRNHQDIILHSQASVSLVRKAKQWALKGD